MPKRTDIKKILVIGSGPIVIGQACEFDYSGTQACRVLKTEGYKVVLINSNPATIMTDPIMADRTYIEPITPEVVAEVIKKERPDALLPTLGGQTALNCAVDVADMGVPEKYGVEYIGASVHSIKKAEDRDLFKKAMSSIGLKVPPSRQVNNMKDAIAAAAEIGFPIIIRPCFTLGGAGGGVAYNIEEFEAQAEKGMDASPYHEILVEQSVLGWKEYELEVMRDRNDNVVIICSIENFDPMGVHTGDSITVAPAQTLTDKEYQALRDYSIACIREIGVDTGGSNIQFAVNPDNGDVVIIEMNPRVSRSSALASKATGFPIAKIAAKLAIGYTLDEIPNDITRMTPACFEPTIDYCVTKIPRFTFEKFPGSVPVLTTAMKSVGETMAIGRTFKESLQKGLRSLETGFSGLNSPDDAYTDDELADKLRTPNPDRMPCLKLAMLRGWSVEQIQKLTFIDPWFLYNMKEIVDFETGMPRRLERCRTDRARAEFIREAKRLGFSDKQLAPLFKINEYKFRKLRKKLGVEPVFKLVDTCGAEFQAYTPYYYSSYELENEGRA
jgi:carbamoyl-phosphate synthase large subunit